MVNDPALTPCAAEGVATEASAATSTLDTSRWVEHPRGPEDVSAIYWSDLDAFTQGYVEALFSHTLIIHFNDPTGDIDWKPMETRNPRFTDLAPETLAAILKDCEAWKRIYPKAEDGFSFWHLRNAQFVPRPDFPPLTVTLGADGKIYLSEAAK